MKILLDENLPRKLVLAMRAEVQEVESVITLRMQGLDNGRLYQFALQNFDLCFTRDFGFIHNVRQGKVPMKFKLLRVTLEQKPQDEFIFLSRFRSVRTWAAINDSQPKRCGATLPTAPHARALHRQALPAVARHLTKRPGFAGGAAPPGQQADETGKHSPQQTQATPLGWVFRASSACAPGGSAPPRGQAKAWSAVAE